MPERPIAITTGDPSGVGPEIIERLAREQPELLRDCVVIGHRDFLARLPAPGEAVGDAALVAEPGRPTEAGARAAWEAMMHAARGCHEGRFRAVVTGPVSKEHLAQVGFPFPGQTEFFADAWGGEPSMGFVGERLRVVLATWHIPLAEVSPTLQRHPVRLERAVRRAAELARRLGSSEPRIAVCGLNPHAGEGGLLGMEEREFLDPLLDMLRANLPGLSRCLPADTVFHRHLQGEFEVVVALYHDQGLAPLKALEFHTAVNVTLGLAHVRTSPDHGTAFGLAGRGTADPRSFAQAIRLAQRLA